MKKNRNLEKRSRPLGRTILSIALGAALSWNFGAQATVTCTDSGICTSDSDYNYSLDNTDNQYPDGYTVPSTIYSVTGENSDQALTITIQGNDITFNTAAGYTSGVTTTDTGAASIGNVTSYLGTSTLITDDSKYSLKTSDGTFSTVRLWSGGWTSFSGGNVEQNILNAYLYDSADNVNPTYVAVEVDSSTAWTSDTGIPYAEFGNIAFNVTNSDSKGDIQFMGLATGLLTTTGYAVSVKATSVCVKFDTTVETSMVNIRGLSNEAGNAEITGSVSVSITESATPVTVSGVYAQTKSYQYTNMYTAGYQDSNDGKPFVSNTTVGGGVSVTLSETYDDEDAHTNVYGVNIGVAGETSVAGQVYVSLTNVTDTGTVSGYNSTTPPSPTTYEGYDQATMEKSTIGSIYVVADKLTLEDYTSSTADSSLTQIHGIHGVRKSDAGSLTIGSDTSSGNVVQVFVQDTSGASSVTETYGIYSTLGTTKVNGNVAVTVSGSTSNTTEGIYVGGGTYDQTGSTTINLTKITGSDGVVAGVLIGTFTYTAYNEDGDEVTTNTNGPTTVTLDGATTINLSTTSTTLSDNIYGVAVASGVSDLDADALTDSEAITVNITGYEFGSGQTGTIYGFVAANGTTYTHGTTTLNFGTSGEAFLSYSYTGSFANFDKVVVNSGSFLYIDTDQGSLSTDTTVFGSDAESTLALNNSLITGVASVPNK